MKTFKEYLKIKNFLISNSNLEMFKESYLIFERGEDNYTNQLDYENLGNPLDGIMDVANLVGYIRKKNKLKILLNKELEAQKTIVNLETSKLSEVKNNTKKKESKFQKQLDGYNEEYAEISDDLKYANPQEKEELKNQLVKIRKQIQDLKKKMNQEDEHHEISNKISDLSKEQIDTQIEDLKLSLENLKKETDKLAGNNPISKRFVAMTRMDNLTEIGKLMLSSKLKISEEEKNKIEDKIKEYEEAKTKIENELNNVESKNKDSNKEPEKKLENSTDIDVKQLPDSILKFFDELSKERNLNISDIAKYKKRLNELLEKEKNNKSVNKEDLYKEFKELTNKLKPSNKKSKKNQDKIDELNKKITDLTSELDLLYKELETKQKILKNPNSIKDPEIGLKIGEFRLKVEEIKTKILQKEQIQKKLKTELTEVE